MKAGFGTANQRTLLATALLGLLLLAYWLDGSRSNAEAADPLPSWNDGSAKRAILAFVNAVTADSAATYIAPAERVAVFDNDGTLWTEHPFYTQLHFVVDRVRSLAAEHPEWRQREPFRAVIEGDHAALARMSEHDVAALMAATHSGMTTDEFGAVVRGWFASARHPRNGRLYRDCVYRPMLELLGYLRANGFRTYVVSGGGVDFMRAVVGELYGVTPSQVIGSSGKNDYRLRGGRAVLVKLPEISSLDDGEGKPLNIHLHIGQRPILAFGNSDGDLEMLQYTVDGSGPRLAMLLHHDDARREYAYDRNTHVGKLDRALDAARESGFRIVSMKDDWNAIFPAAVSKTANSHEQP